MWDGIGWGWLFFFMMGTPFLFLVAVAVLVILLARSGGSTTTTSGATGQQRTSRDNAMDILRQRFARGEIDEDEFDRRRRVLEEPNR